MVEHSMSGSSLCGAQWRSRVVLAVLIAAIGAAVLLQLPVAQAQTAQPQSAAPPGFAGVWYDDSGQGAVEIAPCSDRLCGRVVWLKAPLDRTGKPLTDGNNPDARQRQRPICGLPVIGNLRRQTNGAWDEGWIYDPKQGKQFDLELRLRSPEALQVTGYLGVKFLSETFIWRRAPADIKRCA